MMDIKNKIETGSSMSQAFREHPKYFDALYCNLVAAGESSGMLDAILDRLATYKEKILAIKSKIKSALFYPISVDHGRHRRHVGHHGLGDPVVQEGVHELRRRPARADADRDGDVGFRRQVVVAHGRRSSPARSSASCSC